MFLWLCFGCGGFLKAKGHWQHCLYSLASQPSAVSYTLMVTLQRHEFSHKDDLMFYLSPQTGNYSEALQWYNYSLSFFKAGQIEPNLAKLQRNRASCFLQLQQHEKVSQYEPQQRVRERNACPAAAIGGCVSDLSPATCLFQFMHVLWVFFSFRPKRRLMKPRDAILTAFLLSSVSTRSQCWRKMWREVTAKHGLWWVSCDSR